MYRKNLKNEYYTLKAMADNYPARSVYKLEEIDKKFNLIKFKDHVLDIGCAPGSWLLYASKKVQSQGKVLGIDINDISIALPENSKFVKQDIFEFKTKRKFNIIISDAGPNTSGNHSIDTEKSLELCEQCLKIVKNNLKSGGKFVCKILEGQTTNNFFQKIKSIFKTAKRYKPLASRKQSRELYIIGINFLKNQLAKKEKVLICFLS